MTNEKNQKLYYKTAAALSVIGLLSGFILRTKLETYTWVFGTPVAGLFFPPFLSLIYFLFCAYNMQKINFRHFIIASAIFLISVLPFGKLLSQNVYQYWWDDGQRYSVCAHNMVDHHTLWGGDRIATLTTSNAYVFQAGYRYFLALEFLFFQHENRLFQFVNLFLWCLATGLLLKTLQDLSLPPLLFKTILFFLAGASLYAFKNILMGLSEWLCILLMFLFLICLLKNQIILSVVFLALAVFMRQNELPPVLLFYFLSLALTNKKIITTLVFVAVLLLPVYHNLYYAHKFAFFHGYGNVFEFIYPGTGSEFLDFLIMIRNTSVHYLGFDYTRSLSANLFGICFIPTGIFMGVLMFRSLTAFNKKVFIALIILILASSAVLNYAYFPRFEFANFCCLLIGFIILTQLQLKGTDLGNYFKSRPVAVSPAAK